MTLALTAPKTRREPIIQTLNITPAMAAEMLERNPKNRSIREAVVDAFARDMKSGAWHLNGETVKVDWNGNLLDGQHRLAAVAESGRTVKMLVVSNLPPETQQTIDVGTRRTASDMLSMGGYSNSPVLAAVARRALLWEQGQRLNTGGMVTGTEIARYITEHPEIKESATYANRIRARIRHLPQSSVGVIHMMLTAIDRHAAEEWLEQVFDGIGVERNTPAYALRRRIEDAASPKAHLIAMTFTAWNAHREGRTMQRIQSPKGGWNNGNVPDPK